MLSPMNDDRSCFVNSAAVFMHESVCDPNLHMVKKNIR